MSPRRKVTPEDAALMVAMINGGKSQREIADYTGFSPPTVCRVLAREGVVHPLASANELRLAAARVRAQANRYADRLEQMADEIGAPK